MSKQIRVRGVRRKQIDEDKLALAFLLLAKTLHEQRPDGGAASDSADADSRSTPDDAEGRA